MVWYSLLNNNNFCFNEIGEYRRVLVIQASVNICYFELKTELCLDILKKSAKLFERDTWEC